MNTGKFSITKKKEFKISEEAALEDILLFCGEFDIDVDAEQDKKKRAQLNASLEAVLEYTRRGFLEWNRTEWSITQHLQKIEGKSLTYKALTAKQKLGIDGYDENDRFGMLYKLLGVSSGEGESVIHKLKMIDLKVAESILLFFI